MHTKESMVTILKSSVCCGLIREKSYRYIAKIVGTSNNPFINEDTRDRYFDCEQAVLPRFWVSRISAIRSIASQQVMLGLFLEEKVTAPSLPKSDNRVEFGLFFSGELLRIILMVVRHQSIMVFKSKCGFDIASDARHAKVVESRTKFA